MIRVNKSAEIPPSLLAANCSSYNSQDVQSALVRDQHEKCYLCEQKTVNNFEIDHLKAKANGYYPELRYTWSNLFLTCGYCTPRKPNDFNLLDPTATNIEDNISHSFDLAAKSIIIKASTDDAQEQHTAMLLERLFNGKNKIRDVKAHLLYNKLELELVFFLELLIKYKTQSSAENKQKIIDSLLITKEFLAFKYWIVKSNEAFYDEFKPYMVWNKIG